ncbi:sulfatase [Aquiflexum sp.]|uniref:sulfatase n=1 Tax=Aquiflexum sp. TaxID=1872584 RepID=UPI003593D462
MKQILLIIILSVMFSCKENHVEQRKPNVLFILVDDFGYHDLGITGSTFYETPNIDKLAANSFRFTQGYTSSRVCSPARASIMTGKFTASHGVTDWIGAKTGKEWHEERPYTKLLPPPYNHDIANEKTLGEAFKEAGYQTYFAGKWHLGESEDQWPEKRGFDINVGGWSVGSPLGGYFAPFTNPRLGDYPNGENLSKVLAQETEAFLEKDKVKPFFAMLSFYAVHGPIQSTKEKWSKYRDKVENLGPVEFGYKMERRMPIRVVQDNPVYAGMVEQMDDGVGIVLDALERLGLADNTIVVFTSDHGGVASGDGFATSNLPLRGGKGYQWEGGLRVPYFIKIPWNSKVVTDITHPVSGHDFFPTLLDYAGQLIPSTNQVDGKSLKPLMEGREFPERPLYWHYPHYGNQGGDPSSVLRLGDWKLIHYWEDDHVELYNLIEDPREQNDLASKNKAKATELDNQLLAWLEQKNALKPEFVKNFNPLLELEQFEIMKTRRMPQLEQERKSMFSKDFEPNRDWWGSKLTKD